MLNPDRHLLQPLNIDSDPTSPLIIQAIQAVWKDATKDARDSYGRHFFEYPDENSALHTQILLAIQNVLLFSDEQMAAEARRFRFWINRVLFADTLSKNSKDMTIYSHSVLNSNPAPLTPIRFSEVALDTGASSCIYRFMSGHTRRAMALTSHANLAAIVPRFHRTIQDAIRERKEVYAVPNLSLRILDTDHEKAVSLSQLVLATKTHLKTPEILLFPNKHDAYLYMHSQQVGNQWSPTHRPPIITLVPLGEDDIHYQVLDLDTLSAPVRCAYVDPKDYQALRVELHQSQALWISDESRSVSFYVMSALLKTPYDTKVADKPMVQVLNPTRLNRFAGHKLFVKSLGHYPFTSQDLIQWLDEFYCDRYLAHKSKRPEKRAELKAALAEIKLAVSMGMDLGTNIYECLQLQPFGTRVEKLIKTTRAFVPNYDHHGYVYVNHCENNVWGWKKIVSTFIFPQYSRRERDIAHREFMQSMGDDPVKLKHFKHWLLSFYCRYLVGQKNGETKAMQIHQFFERYAEGLHDLTIEAFVNTVPPGQDNSLRTLINDRRRGHNDKPTWGWVMIEASFIEPERAKIAGENLAEVQAARSGYGV